MNLFFKSLTTLLLCGLSVAPSLADITPQAQSVISAHLKFLSMKGQVDDVDILLEQGKRLSLKATSNYISQTYNYKGPATVTLVRGKKKIPADASVPQPDAKLPASSKPEVLGSFDLPPAGGDFLLLLSSGENNAVKVLPIPFSATEVPLGSCLVWNVSPRSLGITLGSQKTFLPTGNRQILHPSLNAQSYVDLRIFDEYQGKARPLVGGPHYVQEKTRQLIFLTERTPGQAAIDVKVVMELPEDNNSIRQAMNP